MNDRPSSPLLQLEVGTEKATQIFKALASEPRQRILALLSDQFCNVSEIAEALSIPISTANIHISELEKSGLLLTDIQPARRGTQKICTKAYELITISLPKTNEPKKQQSVESSMPVGGYSTCWVAPTCGLADRDKIIGLQDNPSTFYDPARFGAQILWFRYGHVEYRFPNNVPAGRKINRLQFSAELCSEAPMYNEDWPSDVTLTINGIEIGVWTSPGDFGDRPGLLNPDWWGSGMTKYGLLKVWQIHNGGSFIDGEQISDVTLDELKLLEQPFIAVRLEVKKESQNGGGLNLFGKGFGNYPQDLMFVLDYE